MENFSLASFAIQTPKLGVNENMEKMISSSHATISIESV